MKDYPCGYDNLRSFKNRRFVSAGGMSGRVVWHVGTRASKQWQPRYRCQLAPHLGLDDLLIEPGLLKYACVRTFNAERAH